MRRTLLASATLLAVSLVTVVGVCDATQPEATAPSPSVTTLAAHTPAPPPLRVAESEVVVLHRR